MRMIPLRFWFLLVMLYAVSADMHAQNDTVDAGDCYRFNGHYIGSYFTDSWKIIKSPTGWEGEDWLKAGIAVGSWFALHTQDKNIQEWAQDNRSPLSDVTSEYFFDPLGYGVYTMPVYAGLYAYGAIGEHPGTRDFALQGAKVFILSAAFARLIKQVTHRHRPFQDDPPNPNNWDGPFSKLSYDAFPSGHTITAFATAAFLTKYFNDQKWVGWVAYPIATAVGYSRVNDNKHWATDVFAGAVLGHFIGSFLTRGKCVNNNKVLVTANARGGISVIYSLQ